MNEIRILVVDDHEVVRIGLSKLLGEQEGMRVVGQAATAEAAWRLSRELSPDVVILDVRLPDASGIEACRRIRAENPSIRVIMLTSYADEEAVFGSIMAGASGYVLKEIGAQGLLHGIRTVAAGGSLLDPLAISPVLERLRRLAEPRPEPEHELTEREQAILQLVADGRTNREIAEQLYLSEHTVRNYVSRILRKLELTNRTQAAAFLWRKEG